MNVYDNDAYVYNKINEDLREGGLEDVQAEDIIDIIGGYHVPGYGISSNEDLGECNCLHLNYKKQFIVNVMV